MSRPGREYFNINANGDAEPCVFVHFAVDNIKEKSLKEVLTSAFFREIRSRQPFNENPLMPCKIIDNPHDLREAVRKCHAYPTHAGAETLITDLARDMDEYAIQYHGIAERSWREQNAGKFKEVAAS